ncbi:hypothetical protein [Microcoleus sp. B3-D7]|uniref:hypothetical protein n=1 Tax=Microcoleus sp. B3-D7 TaxID=2818659 RepID=UPI002FD6ADCE
MPIQEFLQLFSKITLKSFIIGAVIGLFTYTFGSFFGDINGGTQAAYDLGGFLMEALGAIIVSCYCYFVIKFWHRKKWRLLSRQQRFIARFISALSSFLTFYFTYQSGFRERIEERLHWGEAISYMIIYGIVCVVFGGAIESLVELNANSLPQNKN